MLSNLSAPPSSTLNLQRLWHLFQKLFFFGEIKVYNQDDCNIAVTKRIPGCYLYCSGGGWSVGSIGDKSNNTVNTVAFKNSQAAKTEGSCRIKSNAGTTGSVSNVVYQNITLSGISDYEINIQQDYENGAATGSRVNGVTITASSSIDVTGTAADDAYIIILCGDGSCSELTFTGGSIRAVARLAAAVIYQLVALEERESNFHRIAGL